MKESDRINLTGCAELVCFYWATQAKHLWSNTISALTDALNLAIAKCYEVGVYSVTLEGYVTVTNET